MSKAKYKDEFQVYQMEVKTTEHKRSQLSTEQQRQYSTAETVQ